MRNRRKAKLRSRKRKSKWLPIQADGRVQEVDSDPDSNSRGP
jgi:hypothetical protein